jgi:integrase
MGRPRVNDDDLPMHVYHNERGGYTVKNPLGGKRRYGDRATAIKVGKLLNIALDKKRQLDLLNAGQPTIAGVIDLFIENRLEKEGWKASTAKNNLIKLNKIRAVMGHRYIERTNSLFLTEWLETFAFTADTWNKWRLILVRLWAYAVSIKKCTTNEAAAILEQSQSVNRECNIKSRQGLTVDGYRAIYAFAEKWLQLAMDLALVTMFGRFEVCHMKHSDFRADWLYAIREKSNRKSKEAFFRFPVNAVLREMRIRAMSLDGTECPNLIHRMPDRKREDWEAPPGEHPYFVRPDYLTHAFGAAVRGCGYFAHLKPHELPSFHEIRGLGARLFQAHGGEDKEIQAILGHASPEATQVYLEGGKEALQDHHYQVVQAPLSVVDLLGVKGQNSSNTPIVPHPSLIHSPETRPST